ncbi:WcbI family polysaccharide biosynthesis putative acetyltransferase [Synechococcus sp. AH-603-M21]|nr:WcbI family polysaccharide biosynthesis putative acetyltransferase [Synechococcus sp. AH-603-M21]
MGNWKTIAEKIKEVLKSKNLTAAKEELARGLEKFPNQVNLLTIATDAYRASGDREKSLEYSKLLITHYPDNWIGYGRAAQDLVALKRFEQAQEKIQAGLDKIPNQVNLLTIATDAYRASGDREKSLEYSELLITHHPDNWIGYGRAAEDLIALKRFEEALITVNKATETTNNTIASLKQRLERRNALKDITKSMVLYSGRSYPYFCIAGNCQLAPLETWLKSNFPFCNIKKLAPYHVIETQSQIDAWIEQAKQADFVLMIPVRDAYRGFEFGSKHVRSLLSEKTRFISYPSFYLHVFYPFFGYAKNKVGETLRGADTSQTGHQYGDYHDFLAMALSSKSKEEQAWFLENIQGIDGNAPFNSTTIVELGIQSFNEFEKRYPDYIGLIETNIKNGMIHTYNHPTGSILNEIYKKIWTKDLGLSIDDFVDFTGDPLGELKLPIPSFVSLSILNAAENTPWQISADTKSNHAIESNDAYTRKAQRCISFYQKNPKILEWNAKHKKLNSAIDFLSELGMQD